MVKVKGDWEIPKKIYCVKCKSKTKNEGEGKLIVTSNGKVMVKIGCGNDCGVKSKCQILGNN